MVKGKLFARIVSFFRRKKTYPEQKIPAEKTPVSEEVSGADKQEEPLVRLVETEEQRHVKSNEQLVQIAKPIITEEALMEKKKEIEFIEESLRKYQVAREKELNERDKELEKRLKLSEDVKKLISSTDQLVTVLPKELIKDLEKYTAVKEEEFRAKEEALISRERRLADRVKLEDEMRSLVATTEHLTKTLEDYKLLKERELRRLEDSLVAKEKELEEKLKFEAEMKKLLKVLDELLGKLPKDVIEEFANSEAYELYERILKQLGV